MNPRAGLARIRDVLAQRRLEHLCKMNIHPTAKVRYAKIVARPPSELTIGEYSICEASIASERPGTKVRIGSNTFIGGSSLICATSIDVGDDVLISWGCTIVDHHSHALDWDLRRDDVREWYHGRKDWTHVQSGPIFVRDRSWIGFNTIILAGVTIGEGAVVGCGSIVTRDVPPYTLVAGSPARPVRELRLGVHHRDVPEML